MKNTELFFLIFRQTHMDKFLYSFAVYYVISCILLWVIDPSLKTLGDAFWFGFMIITTIGFGDVTVTSFLGRILTAVLGIYGIVLFGFVCGVGASYLFEKIRSGHDESVSQMVWQLEHLDRLDTAHLSSLKEKVAAHKARMSQADKTAD